MLHITSSLIKDATKSNEQVRNGLNHEEVVVFDVIICSSPCEGKAGTMTGPPPESDNNPNRNSAMRWDAGSRADSFFEDDGRRLEFHLYNTPT